ncbi:hypothetical protein N2152v2_006405 [Parachlorella kessleri]
MTVAASASALQRCAALLSEEELSSCHEAPSPAVAEERLLVRAFVRAVLSRYLVGQPPPEHLVFQRNEHGKPSLLQPCLTPLRHRLYFNLTHTTSLIGLAVTVDALVGLDAESLARKPKDPLRLASRRFCPEEMEDLLAMPEGPSRDAHFLQLWTLKEAYVKALGRGISAHPGLRGFAFRVAPRGPGQQRQLTQQHPQQAASHFSNQQQQQQTEGGGEASKLLAGHGEPACGVVVGDLEGRWGDGPGLPTPAAALPPLKVEKYGSAGVDLAPGTPQGEEGRPAAWEEVFCQTAAPFAGGSQQQPQLEPRRGGIGNPPGGAGLETSHRESSNSSNDSHCWPVPSRPLATSSSSSTGSHIYFERSCELAEHASRRWRFLLLCPSPGHVAALCVEQAASQGRDASSDSERCRDGLSITAFEGLPVPGEEVRPVAVEVLGQGACE